MNKQINKKKFATTSMVVLGIGLIVGGAFAALSDTLTHNETVTIEWVDIVNGSDDDLALEDVNDVTNTPVTELTPGITYELTGTLENDSTVITDWSATNLTTTPGMTVTIADADGADTPSAIGEAVDVSQFGITVQVDQTVTPSTGLNFEIQFSSSDARTVLTQPTAISDVFPDPALAACVASDSESSANGDINYMISQDELDNITGLSCASDGITNIDGIQYMINLTYVDFSNNQITDIAPLSNLVNLVTLNLNNNNIADISAVTNLTNLTNLDLARNEISDLTPLTNLVKLEQLNLYENKITDISALTNLTNLTYLHLSRNEISDISALSNMVNLTFLELEHNNISDVSALANLTNITAMDLGMNQITDFSPMTYYPQTMYAVQAPITLPDVSHGSSTPIVIDGVNGEDLIIKFNTPGTYVDGQLTWDNPGVNSLSYSSANGRIYGTITQYVNTDPTAISTLFPDPALAACIANDPESGANGDVNYIISQSELSNFNDLNCQSMGIVSIEGVQYMNNLSELYLTDNQISDLTPLTNLDSLKVLHLRLNTITDISALANLTNLTYLNLSENDITDITILANMTDLTYLNLRGNNISDLAPLANLSNLTFLNLGDNLITDISALANLTSLTELYLGSNDITDISSISNLTNLTILYFDYNHVTDITPLANLTNLEDLKMNNNQITDFSSLTYQPTTFDASPQNIITLPDTTLGTPTDVVIDGINGEDFIITWNTPGTYENGQLTWDNPGYNNLNYESADGTITGTITQTVN